MNAISPQGAQVAVRPARRIAATLDRARRRFGAAHHGVDTLALPSEVAWRSINEITPRP